MTARQSAPLAEGRRSTSDAAVEAAPAKVNLTLHVTGRRADGYHVLDSLVAFCGVGDRLRLRLAARTILRVTGPFAGDVPEGRDNLVVRAAELAGVAADIALDKHLPAAAGLGGGSSDAAAALRALARLTGRRVEGAETLGADVPVCLAAAPARMRGIGERLTPLPALPAAWLVLVNPGVPLSTRDVFAALRSAEHPPMPEAIPRWPHAEAAADWLRRQRNDLEAPALGLAPAVGDVLAALRSSRGCLLARMSGSGASAFGLYGSAASAAAAAAALAAARPQWWVADAPLLAADQEARSTT